MRSPAAGFEARESREPRVVPAYAVTQGRTRSRGGDLPWETVLTRTPAGAAWLPRLHFEQAHIVDLCRRPVSVAEVAAELDVPLGVARVLVSDLHSEGLLVIHLPTLTADGQPQREILERLLTGLKAHG